MSSTLTDVTNTLQSLQVEQADTTQSVEAVKQEIGKILIFHQDQSKRNVGQAAEDKRENERRTGKIASSQRAGASGDDKAGGAQMFGAGAMLGAMGRILAGTFVGRGFIALLRPALLIMKFLKGNFFKLFARGGLLFIVYELFKDVGDNPAFAELMESTKELWANVQETFGKLKVSINTFMEGEGGEAIRMVFDRIMVAYETLRVGLQTFVLDKIIILTDFLSTTFEGLGQLLEGNYWDGLTTIWNGAKNALKAGLDSVLGLLDTIGLAVFTLFGGEEGAMWWEQMKVDLAESWATMKKTLNDTWTLFKEFFTVTIPNWFTSFKTYMSNGWETVTNFFTVTVPEKFKAIRDQFLLEWGIVKARIVNAWNNVVTFFTETIPNKLAEIDAAIIKAASDLKTNITTKFNSVVSFFTTTIPNKIGELKDDLFGKIAGIKTGIVNKANDMINTIMSFIPSGADIKSMLYNAVSAIPYGTAMLDLLGIAPPAGVPDKGLSPNPHEASGFDTIRPRAPMTRPTAASGQALGDVAAKAAQSPRARAMGGGTMQIVDARDQSTTTTTTTGFAISAPQAQNPMAHLYSGIGASRGR